MGRARLELATNALKGHAFTLLPRSSCYFVAIFQSLSSQIVSNLITISPNASADANPFPGDALKIANRALKIFAADGRITPTEPNHPLLCLLRGRHFFRVSMSRHQPHPACAAIPHLSLALLSTLSFAPFSAMSIGSHVFQYVATRRTLFRRTAGSKKRDIICWHDFSLPAEAPSFHAFPLVPFADRRDRVKRQTFGGRCVFPAAESRGSAAYGDMTAASSVDRQFVPSRSWFA